MQNFCSRLCSLLVSVGVAFLVMGMEPQGTTATGVTSSVTTSVATKPTPSVVSKTTGSVMQSVKTGPTNSVPPIVKSKGTCSSVVLSPATEELAKTIKFDRQVLLIVKEMTKEHIRRLVGYDEDGYQIVAAGIAVPVPEDKTEQILAALRKKLRPLHYLPVIIERNMGRKIDRIGVIKGMDHYEIVRIMHTDGEENDISNQDVLDRLKEWEQIAPFTVIGADSDWVEIEFKTLPKDLKAFVEEVYEFSPGAVEQGPGTVEKLMKEIKRTNRLRLVWE